MISILLTAWKEEKTVGKAIKCIVDKKYSGIPDDFELLLACPDAETKKVAEDTMRELGVLNKLVYVKDGGKGKPNALNMLMKKAKGDIWIFTDGDVHFDKNAVGLLVSHFNNPNVKMVTGRPISEDSQDHIMGYFGHLLADAAHHKRMIDLTDQPRGRSLAIIRKRPFFPVSGYIYAVRKMDFDFPPDTLVDDAYISYAVFNSGGRIEYEPKAKVFVKYPTNLSDYFKQKKRSTGGYVQLWKYGIVKKETKSRSFWQELEYFWFPINYANGFKELLWSLMLYPIRLWLWIMIHWEQKVLHKDLMKGGGWERIETTK